MYNGLGRGGHHPGGGGGGRHHGGGHHGGGRHPGRHPGGWGMPWNYSIGVPWGYGPGWWEPTSYEYILEEDDDPTAPKRKRVIVQKTGLLGDVAMESVVPLVIGIGAGIAALWILTRR